MVSRVRPADATDRVNAAAKFPRVLSPIINVLANILRVSRLEIPWRPLTRAAGAIKRCTKTLRERSRLLVQDAKRSKDEIRVDDCCP